ncbi:site-specific DNA-methyltransferase [Streptococcus equi]|uniref:Phage DNA methylase n=1 Tax=Streptococcus equi subsp. equi (strain 4047) TaxID=553482 RepID=C0MBJ3_STRE4|nr:site-specific DNA-methyltransferase [Streptococcus equi]QBX24152.1 DNA modification methylase [Streptococcus phage Javan178]CAW92152.1 phage DNA methylase [Streptococcus equi subsp. equi 4047]CRS36535.1 phage DNA methylase [Streptococcus equi subsp. equi]CRS37851.1 phage DNA methylase [Streptococcus equi subsp. equi]CRS38697.1 phage DNA methylase [Streptococcus equi subsp. equi]
MQIQKVSISEIKMYENNAKLHPKKQIEQIKSSIKAFGNNDPIAIDESNIIIEGHGRYTALKELGYDEVDVIKLTHLTEEQKKAYILAHNKLTMNTGFDIDILTEELQSIMDIDMSVFGFDVDLAAAFEEIDKELDNFDNTLPEDPKSKFGQIYQLGRHRLMCGDGTNQSDVKKLMGGELADLLITDPPYNVAYQGKTKDALTIQNDNMDSNAFRQFLGEAFKAADSVIKPGAVFYIWHADSEGYNFRGACLDVGWTVRQCLIWNKNAMVLGRQDYHWKHEPCLYGWKDGASHLWASDRKQTTVIDFDKPQRNGDHPTMKPVGLFDYQIKNNTKGHDIVLDLFGGSGTTLIACESNGRCARLMECDPKYVDVIIKRWEELTGESVIQLN